MADIGYIEEEAPKRRAPPTPDIAVTACGRNWSHEDLVRLRIDWADTKQRISDVARIYGVNRKTLSDPKNMTKLGLDPRAFRCYSGYGFKKVMVSQSTNPLVRELFVLINKKKSQIKILSKKAGLGESTIFEWRRYDADPRMFLFNCALNAIGYRLAIVPVEIEGE